MIRSALMAAPWILMFMIVAAVTGYVLRPRSESSDPMQDHFGDWPKVG